MFESGLIRLGSLGAVRPIEEVLRSWTTTAPSPPAAAPATIQKKKAVEPPTDLGDRLIASVLEARPMIGVILQRARAVDLTGDTLAIRFPDDAGSLIPQLERRENLEVVQQHAGRLAGRPVRVSILAKAAGAEAPSPPAAKERAPRRRPRSAGESGGGSLIEKATAEPGVRKLLKSFGAQVVDIRPLGAPED
jgi:hypothetical protein